MINMECNKIVSILALVTSLGLLSACSTVDRLTASITDKPSANYHNNKSVKSLEIPPDLTTPEFDDSFALPQGVISAVSLQNGEYNRRNTPRSLAAYSPSDGPSTVVSISGRSVLRVNSAYSKALTSTEKALTKMEFTTVSKSEKGDVITAKYKGDDVLLSGRKPLSFLSHVTIGGKRKRLLKFDGALERESIYVIFVKKERGASIVRVTRADGEALSDEAHAKIMDLMNTAFRS